MARRDRFRIGDIAKLFHLSASSIRHYEELGLVTPEETDPDTGYRYYSTRQFEVFSTIRYLRALEMPLPEIADFLRNRDVGNIEEKLRQQKAAVAQKQQELAQIQRKIDARLRQLQDAQSVPLEELQLVRAPACRLLWMEQPLTIRDYRDMELPTSRLGQLQGGAAVFLGKVGVSISRQHLEQGQLDQYDGIFLTLEREDRFDGDAVCLPETLCARLRFCGSHMQAPEHYRRLLAELDRQGLRLTGFSREVTMIDYGITSDPEKFVTEILLPVEGTCKSLEI